MVKIQAEVFWVVTLCSIAAGYCFEGLCCLHLQGEVLLQPCYTVSQPGPPWFEGVGMLYCCILPERRPANYHV